MTLIITFLSCFTTLINTIYLLQIKKKTSLYIIGILISTISLIIPQNLKLICTIILIFINIRIYFKNTNVILTAIFYLFLIQTITETLIILILQMLKIPLTSTTTVITGLIIITFQIIIIRLKKSQKIWDALKNKTSTYNLFFIIIIITATIISNINSPELQIQLIIITIALIYLCIIIFTLITKNNSLEIYYENSLKTLKDYEYILDEYRVKNHETQNQLLTIRNMITDNDTQKYIDTFLKHENENNKIILSTLYGIPIPGLKAIIYGKLLQCNSKNINTQCNISKETKNINPTNIDTNLELDITLIIGTLLDNAIEAAEKTKNKSLSIYIYKEDNYIVIQITNTFNGEIYINEIEKKGYSTKGINRGYGLHMVKKIVKKNPLLHNEKRIENDIFIQILKIQYKN